MDTVFEILNVHVLITSILMCIIGIVGLVGNVLMIRAWVRYRKLRSDFYTVFTALGIADVMFLLVSLPTQVMDQVNAQLVTDVYCKSSNYLINVCGFIAAYLIVVLSVLRGILLTNRNTVSRPQAKHLILVSIVFYVIAFVSSIPIMGMYVSFEHYCFISIDVDAKREVWLMNAFASVVPLFLVLTIYLLTYLLGKRFFADSYSPREREKSRLVTCIIIAFVLCQIPYRVMDVYDTHKTDQTVDEMTKIFTVKGYFMCLLMMDKAVRPVLYSKLASDLSEAFDEVVNCRVCSKAYIVSSVLVGRRSQRFGPTVVATIDTVEGRHGSGAALVDRTISTTSSSSATSSTPLTNTTEETDIEMY